MKRHGYLIEKVRGKRRSLTVKENWQIFPVEARGIDFLGYVIRHDYVLSPLTNMKSFKDLGVTYKPADGKKRFEGSLTPLGNLQNCKITVIDFEKDIKTKQGEGRYVVQYEMDGQKGKFITASEEMKNILDQIADLGELPFETVIKRETFGGNKTKYVFS